MVRIGDRVVCDLSSPGPRSATDPDLKVLCRAGAVRGVFEIRAQAPHGSALRTFAVVHRVGEGVPAAMWPLGHLVAQRALYLAERDDVALETALKQAQQDLSDLMLGVASAAATLPITAEPVSLADAVGSGETNAERLALVHEGLGRALDLMGRPRDDHRLAEATEVWGQHLREGGSLKDFTLQNNDGTETRVLRETLRHHLARALLDLATDLNLSSDRARRWAEQINRQSGPLFEFTRAPPLD